LKEREGEKERERKRERRGEEGEKVKRGEAKGGGA
jgi:hypothetical protein